MKPKKIKNIFLITFLSLIFKVSAQENDISSDLKWRNIGPANMMGRIAAIDASNKDYRKVLIASVSGGVFKSDNGGITC